MFSCALVVLLVWLRILVISWCWMRFAVWFGCVDIVFGLVVLPFAVGWVVCYLMRWLIWFGWRACLVIVC